MLYGRHVNYNVNTWKMATEIHCFGVKGSLVLWQFGDASQGKYSLNYDECRIDCQKIELNSQSCTFANANIKTPYKLQFLLVLLKRAVIKKWYLHVRM